MSTQEAFLRVAQVSDTHLWADPRKPYRGQDADAGLQATWEKVLEWGPDIVLLTGDLSEDASEASYWRLGEVLQADVPILALPGNHDDHELTRERFPLGPWKGPLCHEIGNWLILMVDSTLPRRVEGGFSDESLGEIREVMARSSSDHILVALHHQPVIVGAPWIDRWALTRPEGFLALMDDDPRVRCIIWGHIHHHFAEQRDSVLLLGAPSTAANSLPRSDRFQLDPKGPACRTLQLGSDGSVAYGQLYAYSA
jgi:Icc protein